MRFSNFIYETAIEESTTNSISDIYKKYYFNKGEVETRVKKDTALLGMDGKEAGRLAAGESITVMDTDLTKDKGVTLATITYKGALYRIKFMNIQKPVTKGATESLRINANNLTPTSNTRFIDVADKHFRVKVFVSVDDLRNSLMQGIASNRMIPEHLRENLMVYLQQSSFSTIVWDEEVSDSQKNELGKYLGELIVGLLLLNNEIGIAGIVPKGKVEEFLLPDDPSFEGIDSLFVKVNGVIVPISSKFGVGAKASWFSNILSNAMNNQKMLTSPLMKAIADLANKNNINPHRQGKEILYLFGFQYILGGVVKPKDSYKVYSDIRKKKMTDEVQVTIDAIKNFKLPLDGKGNTHAEIVKNLPNSLTAFFSRRLAQMLNDDPKAVDDMLNILGAKDFVQANLIIRDWVKGKVKYSFTRSGSSKLTVIGSKAAIGNIEANQGMVNYLLK